MRFLIRTHFGIVGSKQRTEILPNEELQCADDDLLWLKPSLHSQTNF